MQIHIYADIVYFINLLMNFLIFWICSKLIREKTKTIRIFIGASLGSIMYCMMIFIPMFRNFYSFFTALLILILSLLATFSITSIKKFLMLIIYSHAVAFMVGGMSVAIYHYTNITDVFADMLGFTANYFSFRILILSVVVSYIVLKVCTKYLQKIVLMKQTFYEVKISLGSDSTNFIALVDTGNSLTDPITNSPVIIAEFKSIQIFLPPSIQLLFYEQRENDLSYFVDNISDCEMDNKIRMIPFKSIGKKQGMLIGFKPDRVEIIDKDTSKEIKNVIIGIYNFNLSSNGDYQGLLNPRLLES